MPILRKRIELTFGVDIYAINKPRQSVSSRLIEQCYLRKVYDYVCDDAFKGISFKEFERCVVERNFSKIYNSEYAKASMVKYLIYVLSRHIDSESWYRDAAHSINHAELQWIMEHPMSDRLQKLTRRAFIFSAFTGLSYVDIQRLRPSNIGVTADGRSYIRINRKKTDVESFIPLHPVAERILALYNTTDESRHIFPLLKRNMIWYCIHEIGIMAGVKENLSYHDSRHTFGTLMLSAGVPMESIAKMMVHTNIRTTQGYAKVTDDKISEDMDRLMEKRNSMVQV